VVISCSELAVILDLLHFEDPRILRRGEKSRAKHWRTS